MRYHACQLTSDPQFENQHTYYDICPWNRDERLVVFSSAPTNGEWVPFGHDTLACLAGRVSVLDAATGGTRVVAERAAYMKHGGAFCMWHPTADRIFYRKDREHCAMVDLATSAERLLPSGIRQLSPDGDVFATVLRSPHGGGQGEAVGTMRGDGSGGRELVNRERLYDLTPNRDEFRPEDMLLGNTKWHPGSQHLLVTAWMYPRPAVHRSLYIVSRDGSEARWLTYFAHHHSWTPDGKSVLFNDHVHTGDGCMASRMCLIDFDGTNRRIAFDLGSGSHPLMSPDGDTILDADGEGVYVVHLGAARVERVAEFARSFEVSHHGTHPHPVWNCDGSKIIYNSAETGHSELYLAEPV